MKEINNRFSRRLEERESFLKALIEDYSMNNDDFYKQMNLKEETFFKQYKEGRLTITKIQKASELLQLNSKEISFLFFAETETEKKVFAIINYLRTILEKIDPEDKQYFLERLQEQIEDLKEEVWWTILKSKGKSIRRSMMKN